MGRLGSQEGHSESLQDGTRIAGNLGLLKTGVQENLRGNCYLLKSRTQ